MFYPHLVSFLRIATSVSLLIYAFFFINGTMTDWSENPVQTVIQLTNQPVQSVPFPTITVCPGEANRPLRFGFAENFFNFIRLQCDNSADGDCEATEAARKAFAFILDPFELSLREGLDAKMDSDYYRNYFDGDTASYNFINGLASMMLRGNKTSAVEFVEKWESLYNSSHIGQVDFKTYVSKMQDEKEAMLESLDYLLMKPADLDDCYADTSVDGCAAIVERWKKAYCMSGSLFISLLPTGTLFRTLVYLLGIRSVTYKDLEMEYNNYWIVDLLQNTNNAGANKLLTRTLALILDRGLNNTSSNVTISLMDVPGMLLSGYSDFEYEIPFKTSFYLTTNPNPPGDYDRSFGEDDYYYAWERYMSPSPEANWELGKTPCFQTEFNSVCQSFTSTLKADMVGVLKILRFSQPQFKPASHLYHPFNENISFLNGFDLINEIDLKVSPPLHQRRAFVPTCGFELDNIKGMAVVSKDDSRCGLFEPYWTDSGICGAFNSLPFDQAFNVSIPTNDMFQEAFGVGDVNKTILKVGGPGRVYSFSFTLDAHQLDAEYLDLLHLPAKPKQRSEFVVSIGNVLSFFKVKAGNSILVKGGEKVNLRIIPSQLQASEEIRSIPIESRKCRFSDEIQGMTTLFNFYTQGTCKFQCFIAKASQFCGCIPANYPNLADAPLCDYLGAKCFSLLMYGNGSGEADCGCLPDCHQVSYSYSLERKDIDADEECYEEAAKPTSSLKVYLSAQTETYLSEIYTTIARYAKLTGEGDPPLETPDWVHSGQKSQDNALCKLKIMTDIAMVNVEIASDTIIVSRNVQKSSFEEKLAYVGGTIGLFNGMSFITILDILILVIEFVGRRCKSKKENINAINATAQSKRN